VIVVSGSFHVGLTWEDILDGPDGWRFDWLVLGLRIDLLVLFG
jgi:hypothetical protein